MLSPQRLLAYSLPDTLRFEETAVQQGYLTEAQVGELLQLEETSHRVRLGEALVLKEFVTLESLDRELKEYNKETEHFSAELSNAFAALAQILMLLLLQAPR